MRSPLNLFADAHVFDREYQGTRTFIKELYTRLANYDNIRIFLGAYNTDKLESIFPNSKNIRFVKYKSRSGVRRLVYDIPAIIAANKIDYAHFQYIIPPVKNCRFIVTIHDVIFNEYPGEFSFPYRFSKRLLYKRAAGKADLITTVSEYSKQSIIKHLGGKPANIHLMENGVSESYFDDYDKTSSKNNIAKDYGIGNFILYVSRFEKRKNHAGLLKAYLDLELYKQDLYLVMLGYRSLPVNELDVQLNSLPGDIRKFIIIRSDINDEELLRFYQAADLFVYPSRAEGFGISPLEAGALKIPVICSNSSAMKAFDFFGENHIDPLNETLLAERIKQNIQNPMPAEKLAEISDIIRENYSWDKSTLKFYNLLSAHSAGTTKLNRIVHDQVSIS